MDIEHWKDSLDNKLIELQEELKEKEEEHSSLIIQWDKIQEEKSMIDRSMDLTLRQTNELIVKYKNNIYTIINNSNIDNNLSTIDSANKKFKIFDLLYKNAKEFFSVKKLSIVSNETIDPWLECGKSIPILKEYFNSLESKHNKIMKTLNELSPEIEKFKQLKLDIENKIKLTMEEKQELGKFEKKILKINQVSPSEELP